MHADMREPEQRLEQVLKKIDLDNVPRSRPRQHSITAKRLEAFAVTVQQSFVKLICSTTVFHNGFCRSIHLAVAQSPDLVLYWVIPQRLCLSTEMRYSSPAATVILWSNIQQGQARHILQAIRALDGHAACEMALSSSCCHRQGLSSLMPKRGVNCNSFIPGTATRPVTVHFEIFTPWVCAAQHDHQLDLALAHGPRNGSVVFIWHDMILDT